MKITLFIPCFVDQFYPQVGMSMVRVLERLGHTVEFPTGQTCCGQPPFNAGYWDEARAVAERQMSAFRDAETVVIPSGSCGAMVKVFYPELFHHHPRGAEARAPGERGQLVGDHQQSGHRHLPVLPHCEERGQFQIHP